ncbi:hypothetical protein C5L14_23220 [Labrys okinawensis]|uniref:AAA family ATPase n=1 Tax=Labrys okinawensis TaxID=346911 RepID=A0A2S9Q7S8_9HYPH|nr:AAA family ATPase [Labrys okinawensis]PRH85354.1 hypothetical protein C5L14_23220 [Labrys okinawensis]
MIVISLKEARQRQDKLAGELRQKAADILNPPAVATDRFKLTWFDDIADSAPKETIIKGVFGVHEFTTVSGLPGTGKSVILTDMACHVAAGMEWHGRRVKQGLVVYVAAERKTLTERRLLAFRKKHGVSKIPLLVLGGAIDLTRDTADASAIVAAVKQAESVCGMPCVWIVLDTLTRTFGAGDQNASKDMIRYVKSCDVIMDGTGAHVSAVHHTAWSGERGKGAIDLDGAVDASFMVEKRSDGTYAFLCDGANDGPEGLVTRFIMESVEVGVDEDGEPTSAPVVMRHNNPAEGLIASLKGNAAKALQSLRDTIRAIGVIPEGTHFPGGVRVVTEDQWRQAFYNAVPDMKPDSRKKAFWRCRDQIVGESLAGQAGQWFWLTSDVSRPDET